MNVSMKMLKKKSYAVTSLLEVFKVSVLEQN